MIASLKGKLSDRLRQVNVSESRLVAKTAEHDRQLKDNEDLQRRLASFDSDFKALTQRFGSISDAITVANTNAQQAMKRAIAAEKVRDDAKTAETKALADLHKANFDIKNRDQTIADKNGEIARLDQTRREQKVLIDLVRVKAPGLIATLKPSVSGRVEFVGATGKLVTINVSHGAEFLKAGHTFAIYSRTDGYLGEAVVTEWDKAKGYAFATIKLSPTGARNPRIGDLASTNLSGTGINGSGN